ncbi:extracellular calcium-sensing receptor-like [Pelobates fuscus]|uniref:extracellular calcium-sensing receptor-like n=1 Tax=Pelobates fuscus TaxID=191477 RepID=UPI002FE4EF82
MPLRETTLLYLFTCPDYSQPICTYHSQARLLLFIKLIFVMWPLAVRGSSGPQCLLSSSSLTDYGEKGNITLDFIGPVNTMLSKPAIPFTAQPGPPPCDLFRLDLYKSSLALLFATEEVSENASLLPNITLGFRIWDSCFSEIPALRATFQAISGDGNYIPNYKCVSEAPAVAVIGDPVSGPAVAMGRLLSLWAVPQVSYSATSSSLSNKLEFPSFLRTIVSVDGQAAALIEICKKFGWNWIGILISSSDYGTVGGSILKTEAIRNSICIAFFEPVSYQQAGNQMQKIIEMVRRSTARVIILYCSAPEVYVVLVEVLRKNLTGKVWLGTESWFTSPVLLQPEFRHLLNNTIGIAKSRKILPSFTRFLQSLNPFKYPRMLSIRQFWEILFNCKWSAANISVIAQVPVCKGSEKIVTNDITEYNDPTSQSVYMAYNALYAITHALNNLLSCKPNQGPFSGKSCADKNNFQPWQLLHYLKRVQFVNTAGELIAFDANGNIYGYLEIMNWQLDGNNIGRYVKVGTFDKYLALNESLIRWAGGHVTLLSAVDSQNPDRADLSHHYGKMVKKSKS